MIHKITAAQQSRNPIGFEVAQRREGRQGKHNSELYVMRENNPKRP
jgi:hypothetical protein